MHRVSYCELVRKFMDNVATLVGDKRRRSRLLKRVLCLVQSLQLYPENISRGRAKREKKKQQKQTKRVYCHCAKQKYSISVLLRLWMIAMEAAWLGLDVFV